MKIKHILLSLLLAMATLCTHAQAPATDRRQPATSLDKATIDTGTIYALIVGVSHYEDKRIQQLHYADSDAVYFYNIMRAGVLGHTDSVNIHKLYNDRVTEANFRIELAAIGRRLKPGDKVYIFMAGHGDAASRHSVYFLANPTPRVNDSEEYIGVQAIRIPELMEDIDDMSVKKRAKFFLITDFCRNNELLGKDSLSNYLFSSVMKPDIPGFTSMISCSASQVSVEDDPNHIRWHGHGVFTYYLINGILGLGIKNNPDHITLHDLEKYVADNVEEDTKSSSKPDIFQLPVFDGDKFQTISYVNLKLAQSFSTIPRPSTAKNLPVSASISYSHKRRSAYDSTDTVLYNRFAVAIAQIGVKSSAIDSAQYYLDKLIMASTDDNMKADFTDMLIAALLNEGQKPIDQYSRSLINPDLFDHGFFMAAAGYVAAALPYLSQNPKLYSRTNVSRLFLTARALYGSPDTVDWHSALIYADTALALEQWAYIYHTKGLIYSKLGMIDSSQRYEFMAYHAAPRWPFPINAIGSNYNDLHKYKKARQYYRQAMSVDSLYYAPYENMGFNYTDMKKYHSAGIYFRRAIVLNPAAADLYYDLAELYRIQIGQYDTATLYYYRSVSIKPTYYGYTGLAQNYITKDYQYYSKDSGVYYFNKAIAIDSNKNEVYYNLACAYAQEGDTAMAKKYFIKAVHKNFANFHIALHDPQLNSIKAYVLACQLASRRQR